MARGFYWNNFSKQSMYVEIFLKYSHSPTELSYNTARYYSEKTAATRDVTYIFHRTTL